MYWGTITMRANFHIARSGPKWEKWEKWRTQRVKAISMFLRPPCVLSST
jgi:hypothetical protein